jgi:hypothetical protein
MMLNAGVLTFQEFAMREPLPLATLHEAVLEFVRGRDDVVVFGATAVNAYVSEPRMMKAWSEVVGQEISKPNEDSEFD